MAPIIAISNQQRGVGKTMVTLGLAKSLADKGSSVLMIDNDPQGDLTSSIVGFSHLHADTLSLYKGYAVEPDEVSKNLFIIGADIGLSIVSEQGFEAIIDFRNELLKLKYDFDFIFIDSLPSLGVMHASAVAASDYLMIVVKLSPSLLKGLDDQIKSTKKSARYFNPNLKILGIVVNQVKNDNSYDKDIMDNLLAKYHGLVLDTILPRSTYRCENVNHGIAPYASDQARQCKMVNDEVTKLADEIIKRLASL